MAEHTTERGKQWRCSDCKKFVRPGVSRCLICIFDKYQKMYGSLLRQDFGPEVPQKIVETFFPNESFNPDKVKRIKWSNGADVVSALDYDRLLALYRELQPKQMEIGEVYGEIEIE